MDNPKKQADHVRSGQPGSDEPMSATGMFQRGTIKPASDVEDPAKELSEAIRDEPQNPILVKLTPQEGGTASPVDYGDVDSSPPGEFTRLFQSMEASKAEQPPPAPQPVNQPPSDFTRIFIQIPTPSVRTKPKSESPDGPSVSSQDVTRSGFDERNEFSRPVEPIVHIGSANPSFSNSTTPFAEEKAGSLKSDPGEFTRLMQPVKETLASEASAQDVPQPSAPTPAVRGFSTPGQSNSAAGDGSFTQIFKRVEAGPKPAPPSPKSPDTTKGEFTEIFNNSRRTDPRPNNDAELPFSWNAPRTPSPPSPVENKPSVTRLIRALSDNDDGSWPSQSNRTDPSSLNPIVEKGWGQGGSLTRIGQQLSDRNDSSSGVPNIPNQQAPPQLASAPISGPGEFTRIISGESAWQPLSPANPIPTNAPPPQPAPQLATPPLPQWPTTTPQLPVVPPRPAMGAPLAPAFQPPPVPQAAQQPASIPLSPPASIQAPKSKFQQFLPFLLILNVFVMVVLILLVIFLLRSR